MKKKNNLPSERAPLLGSWNAWYVLLLVVLLLCIAGFYWFTKHFS